MKIKMIKKLNIHAITDSENEILFYIDLSKDKFILNNKFEPVSKAQYDKIEKHSVFKEWLKGLESSEAYC